jgi:hypothetical protein
MTATQFYGGGGNLTGVGVDGIVSTANATAITIDSNENVGIGTASPSAPLHVNGNSYLIAGSHGIEGNADPTNYLINTTSGILDIKWFGGVRFLTNGSTERMRVTSNGLCFNGDSSANNALDDYEEGTWTPRLFKGSTEVTSPSSNDGVYRKVGGLIFLSCYFVKPSGTNTTAGQWELQGMPYSLGVSAPFGYQAGAANYWKINGAYQNPISSGEQNSRWQSNSTGKLVLYGQSSQTNWTSSNIIVSMSGIFAVA